MEGVLEEPKKKRRLLIVDVSDDSPTPTVVAPPVVAPVPVVIGPGHIHGQMQLKVLALCREAEFNEEEIEARIWNKVDEILKTTTVEEAEAAAKRAYDSASLYFIIRKKKPPEVRAKTAERLAKMHRNKGEDAKAAIALEKAKKIRSEAGKPKAPA